VVHRVEDFVREMEPPVAERLMEKVVGRGDRSDQRVFDWKTSGVCSAVAHGGHDILHVPAGKRLEIRPAASSGSLAERSMGTLNSNTHGSSGLGNKKAPPVTGGASMIRAESASALYRHRTGIAPRRYW
jgi:hypothetical protein